MTLPTLTSVLIDTFLNPISRMWVLACEGCSRMAIPLHDIINPISEFCHITLFMKHRQCFARLLIHQGLVIPAGRGSRGRFLGGRFQVDMKDTGF